MNKDNLLIIMRVIFSLSLLAWLFAKTGIKNIILALANFSLIHWLIAFSIFIIGQSICVWRWKVLAEAVGIKASFGLFWRYYFVGCYFNLFLPGSIGGDFVKGYLLSRRFNNKFKIGYSILGDRIFGLIALITLAVSGTLILQDLFTPTARLIIIYGGLSVIILFISFPFWDKKLHKFFENKIPYVFINFWQRPIFLRAFMASLIFQSICVIWNYVLARGMGIHVEFIFYLVAIPIISLITTLPFSIQGIGLREGSFIYLLSIKGVPSAKALTLGLQSFSVFIATGLLGGLIYIFGFHNENRKAIITDCHSPLSSRDLKITGEN